MADDAAGDGTFYTYAYLIWGAKSLLRTAREVKAGAGHVRRAAVVYAAFAIEAHATHIGVSELGWSKSQNQKKSWKDKLNEVAAAFGLVPDYTSRPFKSIDELYASRTHHAHGKTIEIGFGRGEDGMPDMLDPEWLQNISTDEAAERLVNDAYAIMEEIHEKANLHPSLYVISDGAAFIVE